MTDAELQGEKFVVLPLRMETMHFGGFGGRRFFGGDVNQFSDIDQRNFSNQIGGRCIFADCDQFNAQSNFADVDQRVNQRFFRGW